MKWNIIASTLVLGCLSLSTGSASAADEAGDEARGNGDQHPASQPPATAEQSESSEGAQDEAQDAVSTLSMRVEQLEAEKLEQEEALFKLKRRALILPAGPLVESVPADLSTPGAEVSHAIGSFSGAGIGGWYRPERRSESTGGSDARVSNRRARAELAGRETDPKRRRF